MFKLPDSIKSQIGKYGDAVRDFISGATSWARFTGVRVPWGNYSHRGGKLFMSRIRVAGGTLTPLQLRALAHCSKEYGNASLHLTTRQDVQIHEVRAEDIIKIHEYLADYDLSSRGGGGNTIRNITVCALAGVCKDEIFDVRPDAVALTERLIAEDDSYTLPRKLKMAFSGCDIDCAGCRVNDAGFIASTKDAASGYRVWAGGGMGAHSAKGAVLEEFVPAEDAGYVAEAVKSVFYKRGDRRNKHRNRLRFLIQDIGFDTFRKYYADEIKALKVARTVDNLRNAGFASASAEGPSRGSDAEDGDDYRDFLEFNTVGQKQEGFVAVKLRIPRGDIDAAFAEKIAALAESFGDATELRVSQNQNLYITNVRKDDVHKLFVGLKDALKTSPENAPYDFLYPDTLLDITACKGAATCNLGLLNSPALARELEMTLKSFRPMEHIFKGINIKINGCPNACARHPLGLVSFHGMVRRIENRPAPFYKLLVGGGVAEGKVSFARDTGILIPARNMPAFLKEFLSALAQKFSDGDAAAAVVGKYAAGIAGDIAPKHTRVPSYGEDRNFYVDWGRDDEFSLEGTGPGECGAGILDMIESDLIDAKIALDNASAAYSVDEIKKAVFYSARALLVVKGADPETAAEAFADFSKHFVDAGISPSRYGELKFFYDALSGETSSDDKKAGDAAARRAADVASAREFLTHINELYKSMDSSFDFPAAYRRANSK
ncbi:MAG: hypothetical protein CVU77_04550 [Elusimicrobia bacterium HGW-Elusimicrobia-1]|jgi:sulfite reductase (ferredoxin)|nr:MAG: hypothetical protein CVU77_04550 [Elusimicrobia bacterium HGW-Elusimicrobia-1]